MCYPGNCGIPISHPCTWVIPLWQMTAHQALWPLKHNPVLAHRTWEPTGYSFIISHSICGNQSSEWCHYRHEIDGLVQERRNSIAKIDGLVQERRTSIAKIDGLMQERRNFIANALELHLFCTNPSKESHFPYPTDTLRLGQSGCHFVQTIFKCLFLKDF